MKTKSNKLFNKIFNFWVPKDLYEEFSKASAKNYKTASEALRDLMQDYVKQNKEK